MSGCGAWWRLAAGIGAVAAAAIAAACGSDIPAVKAAPGGSTDPTNWPKDDRSLCDWKTRADVEVSETVGPGALRPNVRRVYKMFGEGETRHKSIVCREIDTNLDGLKDVVRTFNAKGEAQHEEADTDYDGKVDVWISFVDGRIAEEDLDTNKDGKPDVWKNYVNGTLSRIKRDRNFDGKPDVWEIYTNGRLDRIGFDDSYSGHIEHWERDDRPDPTKDGGAGTSTASADGGPTPAAINDGGKPSS
jgi:hypothetical protein